MQQHVVFSVFTRTVFLTLPWQVHTSVHTLCTRERNPPLGIEGCFFVFFLKQTPFFFHQKWKGKDWCQCCPAELPGRFLHLLQLQRPPRVSHTGSCNNTAAWSPSKGSWHELTKIKGKLSLHYLSNVVATTIILVIFLHVEWLGCITDLTVNQE